MNQNYILIWKSQAKPVNAEWYSVESPLIFKTAPILEKCSDFQIDFGVNSQVQCDFGLGQSDSEIMKVCVNVLLHLLSFNSR